MLRLSRWRKIFWTPTWWSETCVAVLHSLFTSISSMRLRGIGWSLLRGPMRAIVIDVRTWSRRRCQCDGLAILQTPEKNCWIEQALAFTDESLWLSRLAWLEVHGAPIRRWHLDEAVRQVCGMLITDFRGIFDAWT